MKVLRISLLFVAIFFTSLVQARESFTVATYDTTKMIDMTDPSKSALKKWPDEVERLQKDMAAKQKPIEALQQKLDAKRQELEARQKEGKPVTQEEQASIMAMYQDLQMKFQKFQQDMQAAFMDMQNKIMDEIAAVASEIKTQKDYDLACAKELRISGKANVDITHEVIAKMNEKYAAEKRAKKVTAEPKASKL